MKWVCNFQQNNRLTKLSRATNKTERNKAKIFICPWIMAEHEGRHRGKSFFSLLFSFLAWLNECVSAAPFKSDYLTFRNEFAKETAAYHEAANGMSPRPLAPRTWDEHSEMCRAKGMFVLPHRRQVLVSFHYASSLLLSFSHCLPQGKPHHLKIMRELHSYYSTKNMRGFL